MSPRIPTAKARGARVGAGARTSGRPAAADAGVEPVARMDLAPEQRRTPAELAADENRAIAHVAGRALGEAMDASHAREAAAARRPWPPVEYGSATLIEGINSWEAYAKYLDARSVVLDEVAAECKAVVS